MINRLALALFSLLLVLGINLSTPRVAHAEELPITVVDLRNLPVTGAAPILSESLTVAASGIQGAGYPVKAYRVQVWVVSTDSVFNLDLGDDLAPAAFNDGTTLTAGRVYTFTFEATSADEINFTLTTTTTLGRLTVTEIRSGVM